LRIVAPSGLGMAISSGAWCDRSARDLPLRPINGITTAPTPLRDEPERGKSAPGVRVLTADRPDRPRAGGRTPTDPAPPPAAGPATTADRRARTRRPDRAVGAVLHSRRRGGSPDQPILSGGAREKSGSPGSPDRQGGPATSPFHVRSAQQYPRSAPLIEISSMLA
jgi:hypothetical protein